MRRLVIQPRRVAFASIDNNRIPDVRSRLGGRCGLFHPLLCVDTRKEKPQGRDPFEQGARNEEEHDMLFQGGEQYD